MVCTPAWRRVASAILEHNYKSKAMFKQEMNEKHGVKDEMFAEGIDMLKRGELRPVADPGRVKAMMTGQLLSFACTTYNLEWLLVENLTEIPFATSDNPVAMDYPGPKAPVTRMLPITPSLRMSVTYPVVAVRKLSPEDVSRILRTPPAGEIRRARAKPSGVRHMNKLIVQCAEDQVFSSRADDGMGELVKKYGKFGMDAEFSQLRKLGEPNAIYQGVSICVRERAQQA